MERKRSLRQIIFSRKSLYNFLGAGAFYAGFLLLFALIVRWYTNHGKEITVPDIMGKSFDEAIAILDGEHLEIQIADSSFDDSRPALAIMDQNPKPNAKVKKYRTIYVTVNSQTAPQIMMPDLKDVSLKSASGILESYGLKVGKLSYKPDLAKDVVLEMRMDGNVIKAGEPVKKASKIDLVLGDGLGQTRVEVPDLVGLSLREAKFVLDGSSLNIGAIIVDGAVKGDTLDAIVYRQVPSPADEGNRMLNMGEGVDVFLTSPRDYNPEEN